MDKDLKANFNKFQFIVITIFCYLIPNFILHVLADRPSIPTLLFPKQEFLNHSFFLAFIFFNYIFQFFYTFWVLRKESFFSTSKIKNVLKFFIYLLPGIFEISICIFLIFGNQVNRTKKMVSLSAVIVGAVIFSVLKFGSINFTSKWIRDSILHQRENQSPNKAPFGIERYRSKFLNQTFTLREPWFLFKNYPNSKYGNANTFMSNNTILKIESRESHMGVYEKINPPIEIIYLPAGSKLKVIESFKVIPRDSEYFLDEKELSEIGCGYPVHFFKERLLVLDENNNTAEVTEGDFSYQLLGDTLKANFGEFEKFLKYYAKFETEETPSFTMCRPSNERYKDFIELDLLEFLNVFSFTNELDVISVADGSIKNAHASCAKIRFNTQNAFFLMYFYRNSLVSENQLILDDEISDYEIHNEVMLNFPKLKTEYKGKISAYIREKYLISN